MPRKLTVDPRARYAHRMKFWTRRPSPKKFCVRRIFKPNPRESSPAIDHALAVRLRQSRRRHTCSDQRDWSADAPHNGARGGVVRNVRSNPDKGHYGGEDDQRPSPPADFQTIVARGAEWHGKHWKRAQRQRQLLVGVLSQAERAGIRRPAASSQLHCKPSVLDLREREMYGTEPRLLAQGVCWTQRNRAHYVCRRVVRISGIRIDSRRKCAPEHPRAEQQHRRARDDQNDQRICVRFCRCTSFKRAVDGRK